MADVKVLVTNAQKSKLDGANDISKSEYEAIKSAYRNDPQSAESVKWLEHKNPALYASLTSGLDYDGFTGTTIGALNSTRAGDDLANDAGKRSAKLDKLPPLSDYNKDTGLPKSVGGGDVLPDHEGQKHRGYDTGKNYTNVLGDKLDISDADAKKSREAQSDFCTKMSGVIGADVSNPPSVNAAKGYFKTLARNGASEEHIKKEYGEYLKTFYKHPGGVAWGGQTGDGKAPDPKNLDQAFKDQPLAKDGKRLIDCQGYASLTESVLGDLQKPDGKKMFEVKHASNNAHILTGVYPAGGDGKKGFVVDNDRVRDLSVPPQAEKDFAATKDVDTRKRALLRFYMSGEWGAAPQQYGSSTAEMQSLSAILKK